MSKADATDRSDDSDTLSLRAEIALELDGTVPEIDILAAESYRIAVTLLDEQSVGVINTVNRLGRTNIVVVGGPFDSFQQLLVAIGVQSTSVQSLEDVVGTPAIVFVGCVPSASSSTKGVIERLLSAGSVLVTSDKSSSLPILENVLCPGPPQPPRVSALGLNRSMWSEATTAPTAGMSGIFVPYIRLSPGYLPISPAFKSASDAWVLASDPLNEEPLGVMFRENNGYVIHSVPHWWQAEEFPTNRVGQKRVRDIPCLKSVSGSSSISFGQLCCAWGMLSMLLTGLSLALDGIGGSHHGEESCL